MEEYPLQPAPDGGTDDPVPHSLDQYFRGELEPSDAAAVRTYVEATAARRGYLTGMWAAAHGEDIAKNPRTADESFAHVCERIDEMAGWQGGDAQISRPRGTPSRRSSADQPERVRQQRGGRRSVIRVATIVTAAVLAVVGLVVAKTPVSSARPVVYATRAAQHATVTLRDGTRVLLSDATTLTVPANFGDENRTVALNGQALFTVPHADGAPFVVRATHTEARVLGTSFSVRRYHEDSTVRVTVVQGKVSVRTAARPIILTDGMSGVVDDSGAVRPARDTDVARELQWTRGRLVFEDIPLAVAIRDIERRYGITVVFADSALSARLLTATIERESVSEVLDLLSLALRARYQRSGAAGRTITFTSHGRALRRMPERLPSSVETQYGR
jgi:transmembrane sensor